MEEYETRAFWDEPVIFDLRNESVASLIWLCSKLEYHDLTNLNDKFGE